MRTAMVKYFWAVLFSAFWGSMTAGAQVPNATPASIILNSSNGGVVKPPIQAIDKNSSKAPAGMLTPLRLLIDEKVRSGKRVQLDLFVMSQCPFGVMAEQTLADLIAEYSGKIDFRLNFIGSVSIEGDRVNSLHGQPEVEENIRQMVIADRFPDRLIPYLKARAENYLSPDWQSVAHSVGLDTLSIHRAAIAPSGMAHLRNNIRLAQERGVTASPSLYVDGVKYGGILFNPDANRATQCQTGTDPYTGAAYVVCTATPTYAWISANYSGNYHPQLICQSLGYAGIGRIGGTCGAVCGYCVGGTSCNSPQANTTFDGNGNIGTDQYGMIIGNTVQWECVGAGCPTITVNNPTTTNGTLGVTFNQMFTASGGTGSYTFTTSSTLPAGLTLSSSGVLSGAPAQTGTFPITITATDANSCTGTSSTYNLVISCPTVSVNVVSSQNVCKGEATSPIVFSGSPAGVVYNWTNNNTSIGLAASGTGDIVSFTALNTGAAPITATILVTPSYTYSGTTCTGASQSFTIIVTPISSVDPINNQTLCNGALSPGVSFSGPVTGTIFNWTNSDPSIGLAASGTGNIPSFTATNATASPITATITVTPSNPPGIQGTQTFNYTGAAQTWTVPAGVTSVHVQAWGAGGGNGIFQGVYAPTTSKGGFAEGDLSVTPGQVLNIYVGGRGIENTIEGSGGGGFNGGGNANSLISVNGTRAGGGGASDVRVNGTSLTNRVIVAGGGGGACCGNYLGGDGGGLVGLDGTSISNPNSAGTGGGTSQGGVWNYDVQYGSSNFPPADGILGMGGYSDGSAGWTICGGGGGYYGGAAGNGAGGGSSYIGGVTNGITTPGLRDGDGQVIISYNSVSINCPAPAQTFTITVNPTPTVNAINNQTLCNGSNASTISFSGAVVGTVYSWTNNTPTIGLAASGTGNIAAFAAINTGAAPVVATITVTPSFTNNGVTCTGATTTFTITVNPTPTVSAINNQTLCNGANTTAISFTGAVTGTVYNWTNNTPSIGLAASGTGNIAAFAAINTGTSPVVATITVTPVFTNNAVTCMGTARTFTITVNPTPTINAINNQTLCNGSNTTAISFGGAVVGTVFNWTNNTPAIGLSAAGSGNIASFAAINTGTAPVIASITVTPSYTNSGVTCTGVSQTFTITVNPIPSVAIPIDQTVCNGANTTPVNFAGAVTGTVFNWVNNTTSIGLAGSGTGNIPSFNAINTGTTPITATITVTPVYTNNGVSCVGSPRTFIIKVNPSPSVTSVSNQSVCNGLITSAVNFTGPVIGTVYNWINNTPSIGLPSAGTGNIPAFTAINQTSIPVVATITVTPSYSNGGVTCTGAAQTFTITVNPTPIGTLLPPVTTNICDGSFVTLTATGGATYQWQLNSNVIPGASGATYAATQPGVYTVIPISAFGCRGNLTNSVTLTLITRPAPDFSFDKYCAGFPTYFTNLSQVNGSGVVDYAWSFGDLGVSTLVSPSHIYVTAGTYSVTLAATPILCPALLTPVTKSITIVAPPANQRYPSVNAVVNRDLQLQARLFTGAAYQWLPAVGLNNSGIQTPLFNYNQEQQYRIRITTTEGCVVTDSLLVRIFPEREIYVAGGFTPNGDGRNDLIIPKLVGIKKLRYFKVYDRWGQLIYQTSTEGQGWDGKFKGVPQPIETYVWIAEGTDLDDKVVKRSGNFILFR